MNTEKTELKIAQLLRAGVIVSGTMIALGWVFTIGDSRALFTQFRVYDQIPLRNFLTYYYNMGNWPVLLSYAGLSLLIVLPLIRVFLTGLMFIRQKEHALALIAFIVLTGLVISFSFGLEI